MRTTLYCCIILLLVNCKVDKKIDIHDLPPIDGHYVNMVVEIPAGTNNKIEYNHLTGEFENDQENGKDRIIRFLSYPGNYGFIPGTLMEKSRGGDGDALDVLLLGESMPTASVIRTRLIGALLLKDKGEIDTKLIAVPVENPMFRVDNFMDFALRYDAARRIIEDWFLNYKGQGAMELIRWEDEDFAMKEVKRWSIDSDNK